MNGMMGDVNVNINTNINPIKPNEISFLEISTWVLKFYMMNKILYSVAKCLSTLSTYVRIYRWVKRGMKLIHMESPKGRRRGKKD